MNALPPKESIQVSEDGLVAEVALQDLLNHTSIRIATLNSEVIVELLNKEKIEVATLELICIWGLDAATGHSVYSQKGAHNISSLLAVSLVPLRLVSDREVIWINRTPQSYRYCRPIKLSYVKETSDVVHTEVTNIEHQIERLYHTEINISNTQSVKVKYQMHLTMIDGKILNIITGTRSMQVCAICKATPTMFNKLENWTNGVFQPDPATLQFGVSPLHSWIRFLECCLSISYRLDFKVWQVKGPVQQQLKKKRQDAVKKALEEQMGLLVDCVRAGGAGTSNNRNTARRAFSDPLKFAEILGIDENLVKRFRIILICTSCLLPIDPEKFGKFCFETAKVYVQNYDWFYMPQSIHKTLMHGEQILMHSILPVGVMSEEAAESRHKFFKKDREIHSRKIGPKETMFDIYTRALGTSDPILSSFSLNARLKRKRRLDLPEQVREMLLVPEEPLAPDSTTSSSDDEEEHEDCTGLVDMFNRLELISLVRYETDF